MTNIHAPQRMPGETQKEYRERRASAREAVRAITAHAIDKGAISFRHQHRDNMRKSGTMGRRVRASDALMAAWAAKRVTKAKHRNKDGAYTLVGGVYSMEGVRADERREHVLSAGQDNGEPFYTARRIWLAGISAQRGY